GRHPRSGRRSISRRDGECATGTVLDGGSETLVERAHYRVATVRSGEAGGPPDFWRHAEGDSLGQLARQRHLLAHGVGPEQVPVLFRPENITVVSDKEAWARSRDQIQDTFQFEPHFGWVGAIENNRAALPV